MVDEQINIFDQLLSLYPWRPISGCPGRYVLETGVSTKSPLELCGHDVKFSEIVNEGARDRVVYGIFDGGGLLSYKKPDGYLHTLCDEVV